MSGRQWTRYYEGYPKNWADRLGGVVCKAETRASVVTAVQSAAKQ